MQAGRRREDSGSTTRRNPINVAYNLHGFAALRECGNNTFLRLEEGGFVIILYVEEDCM
jgi:hypothetical protein